MTGFQLFWGKSWRVSHVGQEMLTLSGTPDFTPFGEFMIVLIRYIYIYCVLLNLSVLGLCLQNNDSGLFAWISLTALSRTYFIRLPAHSIRPAVHDGRPAVINQLSFTLGQLSLTLDQLSIILCWLPFNVDKKCLIHDACIFCVILTSQQLDIDYKLASDIPPSDKYLSDLKSSALGSVLGYLNYPYCNFVLNYPLLDILCLTSFALIGSNTSSTNKPNYTAFVYNNFLINMNSTYFCNSV